MIKFIANSLCDSKNCGMKCLRLLWTVLFIFAFSMPTLGQEFFGENFGDAGVGVDDQPVEVTTYFKVKPDSRLGKLYVEATVADTWVIYSVTQPDGGPLSTVMTLLDNDDYKIVGAWQPDKAPIVKHEPTAYGQPVDVEKHKKFVQWSAPIEFAEGVDFKTLEIEFQFEAQSCVDVEFGQCTQIFETLSATYQGEETGLIVKGEIPEKEKKAAPEKKENVTDTPEEIAAMALLYNGEEKINYEKLDGSSGQVTLWVALMGAFIGGMLLNLMPCVFPVLGLKVMSFVEQAGSDPTKIKRHGIAFALGLLTSMWALAAAILII